MQRVLGLIKFLCLCLMLVPIVASADSFKWLQQMGKNGQGDIHEIYVYDDVIYGVGRTNCWVGECNGLLVKVTLDGALTWRKDFNILEETEAFDLTVNDQGVFVVGRTAGGSPQLSRAFVIQYFHDGTPGWVYTNTVDSPAAWHIDHDNDGLYVASGYAFDDSIQILTHFDFQGGLNWSEQANGIGSTEMAVAEGTIYLATREKISVFGTDGAQYDDISTDTIRDFVYDDGYFYCTDDDSLYKLNTLGNVLWQRPFFNKVAQTRTAAVALGNNGIWVVGVTNSNPNSDVANGIRLAEYNLKGQIKNESHLPRRCITDSLRC